MEAYPIPSQLIGIRDLLIEHARGGGDKPPDTDEFLNWLFYDSEFNERLDFDFVFHLDQFDLSDVALRIDSNIGVSERITSEMRLAYFQSQIEGYEQSELTVLIGAHCFPLFEDGGEVVLVCCLGHVEGHGIEPEWLGYFSSKEQFLRSLEAKGYLPVGISPDNIPAEYVLSHWDYEDCVQ
jgi:hypothetical protein